MHRITRSYALLAVAVPVFGVATAGVLDVLTQTWVVASMALTAAAGLLLALVVVPQQRQLLGLVARPAGGPGALAGSSARLMMATGTFNLIWAAVVVLMILRPGSTTGVS